MGYELTSKHPNIEIAGTGLIVLKCKGQATHILDADEAIALGYALFENGLTMKQQNKGVKS